MTVLNRKTSTIPNFQKTRGVLRLLAQTIRDLWKVRPADAYLIAPHMLNLNWAPLVGGCVIKKQTWETIPATSRETLLAAATKAGKEIRANSRKESAEAVAAMQKRGLKVQEPTPEVVEQWRKEVEKTYPEIRGRLVPADIFDEVQRYLQEYRSAGTKK